ncbi:two-component system response regulator [Mameliella alba]|uniref:DNA-binding protein response regulator, LuxR family n=1 Tax=Mameliella alba TaxID=561184 RepID=A0A0B3RW55_9RHOB|nr:MULTISPECIES: response regulator transcription factor [Mameliella]ODM49813.1 two-component system response regulator [Ruegeria sp. PBVC088]KHQ50933.1 DNA-binding protein response regulator, LuxR family [Mameliella alba]MBY6122035.1 response regulator transcription factor [Mameliella alba]MDD9729006.1 response regulator transcription factor [Mameliella sp. AT18]BBU57214.1 two-component system response regulator [Mameliella alba]
MKVLIIEDDQFHATYLQEALAEALPEVTEIFHAADGVAGEEEARQGEIEAIVMDLQMEHRNGIEAARTIWAERPQSRILFWSNYADDAYLRGIAQVVPEESAYGYVLKTASRDRLKLALRAVLVEAQIIVDREIHRLQKRGTAPRTRLDDSEFDVLIDLALGLQDKSIAERRGMSLRTVQNRLLSLYDKLGVSSDLDEHLTLNKRVRALNRALATRTINIETLEAAQRDLKTWLAGRR